VVQRINTTVFPDPEALARNLERVTRHLARAAGPGGRALELVHAPGGATAVRDLAGHWWRGFPFLEGSHSVERASSPAQAERLARAFGGFLSDVGELDPAELAVVIHGFHDLAARLAALEDAEQRDPLGRAGGTAPELDSARALAARIDLAAEAALPLRVVHNDCKLNNLLVDAASGAPLCVVDLDTVMPGRALYDFGELVRSAASTAAEDEPDASRMDFDFELFAGLARGFVAGARGGLAPEEIRSLALAGPRMALENGVRFLADHLEGDRYFPVHRPGHNLDRARTQLRLAERMLDRAAELRDRVRGLVQPRYSEHHPGDRS